MFQFLSQYLTMPELGSTLTVLVTIGVVLLSTAVFGLYEPNFRYIPPIFRGNPGGVSSGATELLEIDLSLAFCKNINIREVTLVELQNALIRKEITSVDLVRCYKRRIEAMNPYLHAILELNPDLEAIAQQLDESRRSGLFLGPLHGIPILIKDNMGTGDKMETTAGSVALLGIKPREDSDVVRKLRKAGAIILGKANMSEFANVLMSLVHSTDILRNAASIPDYNHLLAQYLLKILFPGGKPTPNPFQVTYQIQLGESGAQLVKTTANFRGENMPNGWSGRGNRTRNAYVLSADSSGSSSGSAVAVAANLAPAALGSETDGSIVSPAQKASTVGLKTTIGRVSTNGVIPLASSQDVLGPITRTVSDAAILFNAISKTGFRDRCFNVRGILDDCLNRTFKVGVLRDPNWKSENVTQQVPRLEEILKVLRKIGVKLEDPVEASNGSLSSVTSFSEEIVLSHEFKSELNSYLRHKVIRNEVKMKNEVKKIRNLADIIAFNKRFPPPEGYDQNVLIRSEATDGLQNNTYIAERNKNEIAAKMYINYIFHKYSLDAICVPTTDSSSIPAIAGYPHITVPAGFDSKNLPFGISFYGLPNSDEALLIQAYKLEKHFKAGKTSKFLP